jgi:2-methylcitrate dehydratase PrpD
MASVDPINTISHKLATHLATTTLDRIPPDAVRAAKRVMLDTLGVAWAASDTPGSRPLRDLAVREGGAPDATLIAFGDRVPAAAAALVNGTLAGALDFDCLHEPSIMHCDIVILPAVLAVAERQGATGAEFLGALVLGNDLACRLGSSTNLNGGWFYSALYGGISAAAAAAKLLRLDATGIRHAMGIALSSTGGSRQANAEKRFTKRMQTAFAAQTGVQAALLAHAGVTGPAAILEGDAGIWKLCEAGDPTPVLAELGTRYANAEISLKKFPSCACNHAAVEAAIRIVQDHRLRPDDIARARVAITPYMWHVTGGPFQPGDTPQVDAQFNIYYSVASALLRGRLGVDEILPPAIFDPAIPPMIDRIDVVVDNSLNTLLGPAIVEVTTNDGRQFRERVDELPGTPDAPLSDAEVEAKFRSCVGRGLDPLESARADALIERVQNIERVADMRAFFRSISRPEREQRIADRMAMV